MMNWDVFRLINAYKMLHYNATATPANYNHSTMTFKEI